MSFISKDTIILGIDAAPGEKGSTVFDGKEFKQYEATK